MNDPYADMRDPMRGLWSRLDDSRGIVWRTRNLLKGLNLTKALRFTAGFVRDVRFHSPVFILGAPRSGTTMLFHVLKESPELGSLPGEGHDIWRAFHHPRKRGWISDAVGAGESTRLERRFVNACFYSHFGNSRFEEKTPENCLRVPYLRELFPDAIFVVIKRNPCDVINSLIYGWRHPGGRFRTYFVPERLDIPGHPDPYMWCFVLIRGWRTLKAAPVPRIAFEQWKECTQSLLKARESVPERWLEVHLEDIMERPEEILHAICRHARIQPFPSMFRKMEELSSNPVNAFFGPGRDIWKKTSPGEIRGLLREIAPLALETGYEIDVETGDFRIARGSPPA